MKTALTIAGSDSSGGAGIQADMKTMTANGVYAMSAVTALTAQNTTGVTDILESTPHFLGEQLDAIFTDIFPDAVKIGMVSSADLIVVIAEKLKQYGAKKIVVDPVMVATSGAKLLRDDAVEALCRELLPLAAVLTPNIPEAEILSGMTITDATGMEAAAKYISEKYGCAVLCKGGHKVNDADDLLWRDGSGKWFHGKRINNPNTHGTGCTLSSAIASNLAKGYDLDESVERAKEYISGALAAMLDLGGIVCAMTLVLATIRIPLPTGSNITCGSWIPLMLLALLYDYRLSMLSGWVCGILAMLLIPGWQAVHWAQMFVQQLVCFSCLGYAGVFGSDKRWKAICGMALAVAIRCFGHVISGVIFYSQNAWDGWGAWGYSLTYHISSKIPEGIFSLVILMILPLGALRKAAKGVSRV